MSDEPFFCDYCGYNSDNGQLCSHCGRDISDLVHPAPFSVPLNGRMTLCLRDSQEAARVWKELAEVWYDKRFSSFRDSQLERFDTDADTVELYGTDYMADIMREAMGTRGTVDFQELSREQLPQPALYKPLRPPSVPRNKR
jgi:hypothetical protein